jgi:hypothetical protein
MNDSPLFFLEFCSKKVPFWPLGGLEMELQLVRDRARNWVAAAAVASLAIAVWLFGESGTAVGEEAGKACRIVVVDKENGWPVPLVELRTTNQTRFVTDNAGVIAMDAAELMNQEVWFAVHGHGYGVAKDGFGFRGVRLVPKAGETIKVEVERSIVAKRIGRLTGAGLFGESQKLGDEKDWRDAPLVGCDSVQNAVYGGKMFWAWGDTTFARYPLGAFHMTSATTAVRPFEKLQPPLKPKFDYFLDERGLPRGVAAMPGEGPTWLTGYVALPDAKGKERLVAYYRKIRAPRAVYEAGLCVWDDESESFEHVKTVWRKSSGEREPELNVDGHPAFWTDASGKRWLLFGNPLPRVRLAPTFEAWQDTDRWEELEPQKSLAAAGDRRMVTPHSGSIAWNTYRGRWVTVFMEKFGKPSALGELWYAEADSPLGPWGPAVKVVSHDNYTFYNPRLHPEFTADDSPVLLFEGTYTMQFADRPEPTPKYDYNQILYRLDLDDAALKPARGAAE